MIPTLDFRVQSILGTGRTNQGAYWILGTRRCCEFARARIAPCACCLPLQWGPRIYMYQQLGLAMYREQGLHCDAGHDVRARVCVCWVRVCVTRTSSGRQATTPWCTTQACRITHKGAFHSMGAHVPVEADPEAILVLCFVHTDLVFCTCHPIASSSSYTHRSQIQGCQQPSNQRYLSTINYPQRVETHERPPAWCRGRRAPTSAA